jgi:DNA-binding response OmpR family regulator
MTGRVLVVEDSQGLADGLRHNLEVEGYVVRLASTGPAALHAVADEPPDLMILDLMLPGKDGFQVLAEVRESGHRFPVIILTARGEEVDKVRGFRLDADQYVTKPFGLLELLERVRALLRRQEQARRPAPSTPISFSEVEVDPVARTVTKAGRRVAVTPRAFDLLLALIAHEGRALSRQQLLRDVWGYLHTVTTRTVDSHVSELRQKLEDDAANPRHIHTVWRIGYRFER